MNYIPMELLPQEGRVAIIMRHAERDPVIDFKSIITAMLTPQGQKDARELGRELAEFPPISANPVQIYHSPIPRCQETAEHLYTGLKNEHNSVEIAGRNDDVGTPYFVGAVDSFKKLALQFDMDVIVRKWFNGELPDTVLLPPEQAALIQLRVLIDHLKNETGSSIYISHDWNIMLLREYYFGLRHEDIGPPDFLDGIAAYIQSNELHLQYHEHHSIIPLPLK
ncbi:MAG: histidine phosphatase family protein [bacterium]|nr:histidine phosphatase family protein [bacterium]